MNISRSEALSHVYAHAVLRMSNSLHSMDLGSYTDAEKLDTLRTILYDTKRKISKIRHQHSVHVNEVICA